MFTDDIARFLDEVRIPLRLAATTESGWPTVISLWYVLDGQSLWCATQDSARIVSYLRGDARCAFEITPVTLFTWDYTKRMTG